MKYFQRGLDRLMKMSLSRKFYEIIIILAVVLGTFIPLTVWLTRPCQIERPQSPDWEETLAWIDANITSDTAIVAWGINADYINLYSNCTSPVYCGMSNHTIEGLVGRQFMATNETDSIAILNSLNANYVLVTWSYYYPNGGGDEYHGESMIRAAAEYLDDTEWEIEVNARWNDTTSKPTCEFFDTTLWKMLTYYEPFIDYDEDEGNAGVIKWLVEKGYPLGYFLVRLNWADPWVPGTLSYQGTWEDDSGHLWKYHNPPLGDGMVDDGYINYDNDVDDDTVGQFMNLDNFTPVFVSSAHWIKIFKIS
jgi:hypothetical protein